MNVVLPAILIDAVQLALLTFVRSQELRLAKWSEIDIKDPSGEYRLGA